VNALRGTEYRAQRAFERQVLAQIVDLAGAGGDASAELVEQALGYYRGTATDNQVQQVLGRRLRAALAALAAEGLLDPAAPAETLRPTAAGRARIAGSPRPWWRRLMDRRAVS
jgi:hypothetical protein